MMYHPLSTRSTVLEEGLLDDTASYRQDVPGYIQLEKKPPSIVTIDIYSRIMDELIHMWGITGGAITIHTLEMRRFEDMVGKMAALDNVFGLLDDLSPEEITLFDDSIKRRDLF